MKAFITGASGFIGGALTRRLVSDGWEVIGLARSADSERVVGSNGAEPVRGDLDAIEAITEAARGADVCFHAAAFVDEWGGWNDYKRVNVEGTRNVIGACHAGGVGRLVFTSSEAAVACGKPMTDITEKEPLQLDSSIPMVATKARAEELVQGANSLGLETVVVRPRWVWGLGDTRILPLLVEAVKLRRFMWIGGGDHLTATTHIHNAVEGLMLAYERGKPGAVYFINDGKPVVYRDFVTKLLATQGITPPGRTVSRRTARLVAAVSGVLWRLPFKGPPPVTRVAIWMAGMECTPRIDRAREELGYEPVISVEEGLEELAAAGSSS